MGLISGRPLKVLKKPVVKAPKKTEPKQNILTLIQQIKLNFDKYLIQFKDDYEVIYKREDLEKFVSKLGDIIAVDTETTGLGVDDKLVGVCVYTPGEKAIYVPVYHIDCIINKDIEEVEKESIKVKVSITDDWTSEVSNINTKEAVTLSDEEINSIEQEFNNILSKTTLGELFTTVSGDYDTDISTYYSGQYNGIGYDEDENYIDDNTMGDTNTVEGTINGTSSDNMNV